MSAYFEEFGAYMRGESGGLADVRPDQLERLRIYRNGSIRSCTEVLRSNYPSVARLAGEADMTALAVGFVTSHPPAEAHLTAFGRGFPEWLAERCADGGPLPPNLVSFARLDRAWTAAYFANDEALFSPARAGRLAADDALEGCVVRLATHVNLVDNDLAVLDAWVAYRQGQKGTEVGYETLSQCVAVWREEDAIRFREVGRAEWAFFSRVKTATSLGAASEAALAVDPEFDLGTFFASILEAGLLCEVHETAEV